MSHERISWFVAGKCGLLRLDGIGAGKGGVKFEYTRAKRKQGLLTSHGNAL